MVKLIETNSIRTLHIGSTICVLNESDYQELIKIFNNKKQNQMKAEWHKLTENNFPMVTEKGSWDGKRSEQLIVCDSTDVLHIVRLYVSTKEEQGIDYQIFFTENDIEIKDVVYWSYNGLL